MRVPTRPPFLPAFSIVFGPADATYSRDEETYRRNVLCREARTLMPAADHLTSSRLVDRLGVRNGRPELFFDLEFTGQMTLPLASGRQETITTLLEQDLALLRSSAADQQGSILQVVSEPEDGHSKPSRRPSWQERALKGLMKSYRDGEYFLSFTDDQLVIRFPDFPGYRGDEESRWISAIVLRVEPDKVRLTRIQYADEVNSDTPPPERQQKRFALLPVGEKGIKLALLCTAASCKRIRVFMRVKQALDYLTGQVAHFEIEEIDHANTLKNLVRGSVR